MSVPATALPAAEIIEAALNYRVKGAFKPAVYPTASGRASERAGAFEYRTVAIADGRPVADRLTLDGVGFELHVHDSAVADFLDEATLRRVYYPEVERLVTGATGASRVVIFDHTLRIEDPAERNAQSVRAPVHVVHNDYTERSARQRVRDLLDADDAARFLAHRFAIVNVWRSIGAPVETTPIAIADAQSIAPDDFVATDLIFPDRTGEIYQAAYNPDHRWFYFPGMRRDEALLLKCYDSATDGRARFTAHTAFEDPTASPDAAPRESIEVRTLVSFAP